jgi:hypothetical protein
MLPETGETPWLRTILIALLITMIVGVGGITVKHYMLRRLS